MQTFLKYAFRQHWSYDRDAGLYQLHAFTEVHNGILYIKTFYLYLCT